MRTIGTTALAALTAGLLVTALAGCAEPADTPSGSPTPLPTSHGVQPLSSPTAGSTTGPTPGPTPTTARAPLTGGSTQISFSGAFAAELQALRVTVAKGGRAALQGTTLSLPITGGSLLLFSGGTVEGDVLHAGSGLVLRGRGRSVELTDLVVIPGSAPYITGDVVAGGATRSRGVVLFTLDPAAMASPSTTGGQTVFSNVRVELDPGAATLLDARLGTTALQGSTVVGAATITAE
ncbi:hypothetical protein QDR37_16205 [Amnibacterium sp. CER49]|uniref:hypothetical protein n=1 Tax=Amnibacterium sp. CER49 TaxID=3039161 RepID=UPI00244B0D50|nr:hypothetical protein [Amnibacterium sp. CER49]MDH2445490.1 hypothetical protein [Amnibacterium sp. CER49]